MRNMLQKPGFLLFELQQAPAHPVQPCAEIHQILRPMHAYSFMQLSLPHVADGFVNLSNRAGDPHGKKERKEYCKRDQSKQLPSDGKTRITGHVLHFIHLALYQYITDREKNAR